MQISLSKRQKVIYYQFAITGAYANSVPNCFTLDILKPRFLLQLHAHSGKYINNVFLVNGTVIFPSCHLHQYHFNVSMYIQDEIKRMLVLCLFALL